VFKERGIFIDIFPLDRLLPWTQRLRLQSVAYNLFRKGNGNSLAMKKIRALTWFNRHIPFPLLRGLSRLSGTKALMCDYGIPFHNVYDLRDVFPLETHDFEGIQLPVPGNSLHMLQTMFGDYMQLPEDLDNVYHHVDKLEFLD
jgi:phosphorylcholine metabolism protein LicD